MGDFFVHSEGLRTVDITHETCLIKINLKQENPGNVVRVRVRPYLANVRQTRRTKIENDIINLKVLTRSSYHMRCHGTA